MNKIYIGVLLCLTLFIPQAIAVQNINDLVDEGKLTVTLSVPQGEPQIVGQALVVSIDIATDRWFATGSKVQSFNMPDVVMQANNITTINGNDRIDGKTWAIQTHEITLYPTLPGTYQLPKFNIDVSINTENDGIISGILTTQAATFDIVLPEALNGIDEFIVSPKVTLTIDGQFDADKDYPIGDAITQTFTITATDTPAMMIPEVNFTGTQTITDINTLDNVNESDDKNTHESAIQNKVDGISIYHKPAKVFDKTNRGTLLGTRVESFTYIFEKAGTYQLPERVIYWWNSDDKQLEKLVIPKSTWTVSGGGLTSNISMVSFNNVKLNLQTVIAISISILLLFICYICVIKRHCLAVYYKKVTKSEQRKARSDFLNAVKKQNYLAATQFLYQYNLLINKAIGSNENAIETKLNSLTAKLNQLAFAHNIESHSDDTRHITERHNYQNIVLKFSIDDAEALIKQIDILHKGTVAKKSYFTPNEHINLTL